MALRVRRSPRACLAVVGIALSSAAGALALDPHKAVTQYSVRTWSADEGLPQNSARALAQTPDGYLWIGTEEGLARFDGMRFEVFGPHNAPGLRDTVVLGLAADGDGALWITLRRGFARYKDGRFTAYGRAQGVPDDIRCGVVCYGRSGRLWLGSADGLRLLEGDRFVDYGTRVGLPRGKVTALHEARDGSLWIGLGRRGLFRWADGRLRRYTGQDGLPDATIYALHEDASRRLWIGTWGGGAARLDGERIVAVGLGESARRLSEIAVDRDGNVWIAGAGGVFRYREDRPALVQALPMEPHEIGMSLLEDREGNIWAGLRAGGLLRLTDTRFTCFAKPEGLSDEMVTSVFEDGGGDVWIGTETGGLNRLRGNAVETLTTRDGLSSNEVTAVWRGRGGDVWIGTDRGLDRLRAGRVSTLRRRDGLVDDEITAVLEDRRGDVWIGTSFGLNHWRDGRLRTYTKQDGLGGDVVSGLYEGRDGSLWILTADGGVTRRHDGVFTRYGAEQGLRSNRVLSVHDDGEALWMGTLGGGLARLKEGRIASFLPENGLPTDKVALVLDDDEGHLWLSTNKGVLRVAKSDLDAMADGRHAHLSFTSYGRADGMRSRECRTGGWKSRDGRLWFATVKGLAVVDPRRLEPKTAPPPVVLERMSVDGHDAALAGGLELPAGSHAVELVYTGLGLAAPETLRFRYRLFGFDRDWQDAGDRRAAYYTNLPPGRYRFQVLAATHEDVWNEEGASLEFRILPRFHQTPAFVLLAAALVAAAGFVLHRFKVAWLEAHNAVLEERNRIAREVHDGVAQGIGGIAMQLEAARGASDHTRLAFHVERARSLADETLAELRRSLSALRPMLLDGLSLPEALDRFIEGFGAGVGIDVRLDVRGIEADLDDGLAGEVFRIVQEALYNAARHGRAARIQVELAYEPRGLRLRVADDGTGFGAGARGAAGGHGLRSMRERADRLGGRFSLRSEPGRGTELLVTLPRRGPFGAGVRAMLERFRGALFAGRVRSA